MGFLSHSSYILSSYKFGVHFHLYIINVEHSWQDYIYSPATLYGAN
nr:MAG TPA: hypothetical protein [Caudoviricetes sp.]